jgi:hypothetical protein
MSSDWDILEGLAAAQAQCPTEPQQAAPAPNLADYDRIIVAMSGKDSLACLLHLLELGVDRGRLELMHHDVDGAIGDGFESTLMDWPCTHGYIAALGKAFDIPVLFSYRVGGIERELLRENCGSAPVVYTRRDGQQVVLPSDKSKANTRLKFPQVTANLALRWCSAYSKISVSDRLLIHDARFRQGKTLIVTGERAEESPESGAICRVRTPPRGQSQWPGTSPYRCVAACAPMDSPRRVADHREKSRPRAPCLLLRHGKSFVPPVRVPKFERMGHCPCA